MTKHPRALSTILAIIALLCGAVGCGDSTEQPSAAPSTEADAVTDAGLVVDSAGKIDTEVAAALDAMADAVTGADATESPDAQADSSPPDATADAGPAAESGLCAAKSLKPWSRKSVSVGGSVSFNEIMYHAPGKPELEWIELYNPLGIDMDVSGFHLEGSVHFTFAAGTFIKAHGFLVVAANADALAKAKGAALAIGSYAGQLSDDLGAVELWNNFGRLMDSISYGDDEPWPTSADGSGASLAKRVGGTASPLAENWIESANIGGTPGAANFPLPAAAPAPVALVAKDAVWHYQNTGVAPVANWASAGFDDSTWPSGTAAFFAGDVSVGGGAATANFTADNFFAIYVGKANGSGMTYVGRDAVGDWTTAETLALQAKADDYVYVAAWEAPGDNGGPQALIGEFKWPGGGVLGTSPANFDWVLGPPGASPGGALSDPAPPATLIQSIAASANSAKTWAAPQASADKASPPWGGALNGVFSQGTQFIWADTFGDVSASNTANTFVLFRSKAPLFPSKGATKLAANPTTTYFRTHFKVAGDVDLVQPWIDALVDDGGVFYLNGKEILRLRMPTGAVDATTLASIAVADATLSAGNLFAKSALLAGENVLAVEVHQATAKDPDLAFAASVSSSVNAKVPGSLPIGLVFNEVSGASSDKFWLELINLGTSPLNTGGYTVFSTQGTEVALEAHTLAPGELLVVNQAKLGFGASAQTKLFLYPPDHTRVLDGVTVAGVARARKAGASPAWWYPDVATPAGANVFVAHDEVVINEIMYRALPVTAASGALVKSSLEWIELYNRSQKLLDISGYQFVDAIEYTIPAATFVPPNGYFVVCSDLAAMKAAYPALAAAGADKLVGDFKGNLADSGENLVLRDACANPVDIVRYSGGGSWPDAAHGGGSSLELRDVRSDNAVGDAWAASDDSGPSQWQIITYEGVAAPSAVGPDGAYQELVVGMLDAGVALVDDISVIEDPVGAKIELMQNGNFENNGATSWRLLGNHRHSEVIADPNDPANHVLRLVATGAAEHMHNHMETTLAAGHKIANGKTYRISLRAKWQTGSNRLNTRLYFDRLAKTHLLPPPLLHGTPGAANGQAKTNIGPTYTHLHHAPAVPHAFEPVVVSVIAADPDGVAKLSLWYAVDGASAVNLPMAAAAGGQYSALVPGGAASSVYQFYVVGEDTSGVASSFPADAAASRAMWQVDDGKASTQGLHNLRIVMPPDDVNWLFDPKNLMSNDRIGCTVIDDELGILYDVGLRLKGSERGRVEAVRVGFALRFSPEQPFRGIYGDIMLDRSEGIGFGQREVFFNQAMNHAGIVTSQYDDIVKVLTPRTEHTGAAQAQLARFGDLLLDNQFEKGSDGSVFEYELIYYPTTTDDGTPQGNKLPKPDLVVGTGLADMGNDKEAYRLPFILKNNRWKDDYKGLMAFAKVFGLNGAEFNAKVGDVIDVDAWLRAFAFAVLSGAVDNFGAGDAHNGNFYVRPSDSKVLYLPHDLDFYGGSPQSAVVASPHLAKIIGTPPRKRMYYGHLYDIISTAYNGTYMKIWSDHLGKLLPGQDFAGHLQFVAARADFVLNGAPNAVMKAIAKIAFQIKTNGGAPLAVTAPDVTLDGVGWIDVSEVQSVNPTTVIALNWTGETTWQATVSLKCGVNAVELQAFDRHAAAVGSSKLTVTRSGAGCP